MLTTDVDLFERVRANDADAFRQVVQRHHPRLLRLASTCTAEATVAAELVRNSWAGFIRIARCGTYASSLGVLLTRMLIEEAQRSDGADPPHPATGVVADDAVTLVCAIRGLPELDRWVVVLRDLELWSAADVGDCLAMDADELRSRLHRARTTLLASSAGATG